MHYIISEENRRQFAINKIPKIYAKIKKHKLLFLMDDRKVILKTHAYLDQNGALYINYRNQEINCKKNWN